MQKKTFLKACFTDEDVYLAIPLQKGQISCRELMRGEVLLKACKKDEPLMIDSIDNPYANSENLKTVNIRSWYCKK